MTSPGASTDLVVTVDVEYVGEEDGAIHDQEQDGQVVGMYCRLQALREHGGDTEGGTACTGC